MKKTMQATETEPACYTLEYEQALEDAIAEIREDADRVEKIIEENSDLIQDIYFNLNNGSIATCEFGREVSELLERKIEACAENDVEKLL
jgi:hypothetical protein